MKEKSILPGWMVERQEKALVLAKKLNKFAKTRVDWFKTFISPQWNNDKYELTLTGLEFGEVEAVLDLLQWFRADEGDKNE